MRIPPGQSPQRFGLYWPAKEGGGNRLRPPYAACTDQGGIVGCIARRAASSHENRLAYDPAGPRRTIQSPLTGIAIVGIRGSPQSGPTLHPCFVNWTRRLSCASATLFKELRGTAKCVLQNVQTPTAGIVPSHLITLRLRIGIDTVSHMFRGGSTALSEPRSEPYRKILRSPSFRSDTHSRTALRLGHLQD
jgi:hypothetical protein